MDKTMIVIQGKSDTGKSETIKNVCKIILSEFPNAKPSINPVDYSGDIFITIDLDGIRLGIESQGDPNSRMINEDSLKKLADKEIDEQMGGCDIILCASRTSGMTFHKVYGIAESYNYNMIWMSSYMTHTLNKAVINKIAAENIIGIIKSIIVGQICKA